ncbi:MAG: hypothetical protein M3N95_01140, partial [Actinomycetota bacterium]|nr:hypothetical protein [Actinomycetota bacterium]
MTNPLTQRRQPTSTLRRILRLVLPPPVYRAIRSLFMALFTPSFYAAQHGFYRSALSRSVVAAGGAAAPWMTFPLVTFLDKLCFRGRTVIEFGAGQSTIWWGARADTVLALETDPQWSRRIVAVAPANVEVVEVPLEYGDQAAFDADVRRVVGDRRFDVVVVDGGDRVKALLTAPAIITDDGFIVLDDLDLFADDPSWLGALGALRQAGFGRIDFYGLAVSAP